MNEEVNPSPEKNFSLKDIYISQIRNEAMLEVLLDYQVEILAHLTKSNVDDVHASMLENVTLKQRQLFEGSSD